MKPANFSGFTMSSDGVVPDFVPRCAKNALEFLEKLKFRKLATTRQVSNAIGVTLNYLNHFGVHPALSKNRFTYMGKVYWGSKRTIMELNRQNVKKGK